MDPKKQKNKQQTNKWQPQTNIHSCTCPPPPTHTHVLKGNSRPRPPGAQLKPTLMPEYRQEIVSSSLKPISREEKLAPVIPRKDKTKTKGKFVPVINIQSRCSKSCWRWRRRVVAAVKVPPSHPPLMWWSCPPRHTLKKEGKKSSSCSTG